MAPARIVLRTFHCRRTNHSTVSVPGLPRHMEKLGWILRRLFYGNADAYLRSMRIRRGCQRAGEREKRWYDNPRSAQIGASSRVSSDPHGPDYFKEARIAED